MTRAFARPLLVLALVSSSVALSSQTRPALRSSDPNRPVTAFVLDMAGDGYPFTTADEGVTFDMDGTKKPIRIAWTKPGGDEGFLFLDTNGNGRVDSGQELLGDGWRRPDGSRVRSCDETLLVIQGVLEPPVSGPVPRDQAHMSTIDAKDDVFAKLRFWRDANHNGQSEPTELQTLPDEKIQRILLSFGMLMRKVDPTGNILLVEGSFFLQPPADCKPQPGVRCEVLRRMVEVEFARKK